MPLLPAPSQFLARGSWSALPLRRSFITTARLASARLTPPTPAPAPAPAHSLPAWRQQQHPSSLRIHRRDHSSASATPAATPEPTPGPGENSSKTLHISPRAVSRLRALAVPDPKFPDPVRLRIAVLPGGCHGFQYQFELEDVPASLYPSAATSGPDYFSHPPALFQLARAQAEARERELELEEEEDEENYDEEGLHVSGETRQSDTPPTGSTAEAQTQSTIPEPSQGWQAHSLSSFAPQSTDGTATSPPQKTASPEYLSNFPPDQDVFFGREQDTCTPVVVDLPSLDIISGARLDYVTDLLGSQFTIVDIPGSKSSCGCGTSFDISFT